MEYWKCLLRRKKDPEDGQEMCIRDRDIREGDAIIMFSKRAVLDMAARLELSGISASVISVSYTHLDVYKRQALRVFFTEHRIWTRWLLWEAALPSCTAPMHCLP